MRKIATRIAALLDHVSVGGSGRVMSAYEEWISKLEAALLQNSFCEGFT